MKGWLFLLVPTAIILLYPALRFLLKRLLLRWKLKRTCRRAGAELCGTHALWMFGSRRGQICDFIVRKGTMCLSVKLFATRRRASHLIFTRDGCWYTKHFLALFAYYQKLVMPWESRRRPLPQYDFQIKKQNGEEPYTRVLLVHPVCMEIRHEDGAVPLGDGDEVNGLQLFSLAGLIRVISA